MRETPDRVIYLVNNGRRRWHAVKCWECGNKHSPPTAQACTYCSAPLGFRRLLMTSRWGHSSKKGFAAFARRRIKGQTLSGPLAIYRYNHQMLAFFSWDGENLLVNEPAPLSGRRLLAMAFQLADAVQLLHNYGVMLGHLGSQHVLLGSDGSARLLDLDVQEMLSRPIVPSADPTLPPTRDVRALASLLSDYCPVEDDALRKLLVSMRRGGPRTADEMAGAVNTWARRHRAPALRSKSAALSDTGIVQHRNDDAWTWRALGGGCALYAVADGCSGPLASGLAIRTVGRLAEKRNTGVPFTLPVAKVLVGECFNAANQAVRGAMEVSGFTGSSDTTLCVVARTAQNLVVGSVGDTCAWVLRQDKLQQLGEREQRVQLVGGKSDVKPTIIEWKTLPGDRLLIGSRGLWREVSENVIATILHEEPDPRSAVRRLVRAANDLGGRDNVTAMVVDL
ncbi:MAG: hypothetical protein GWP91_11400 [Rhodobacterales bacterium]|nr:hypothetical protein [Rhodobacterales bacterium]